MHLEILVEEPSVEMALHNLLPKLVTEEHTYRIITFQGKRDLLGKLELELKGYYKSGFRKTEVAHNISLHMEPLRNRSKSFQIFWGAISEVI